MFYEILKISTEHFLTCMLLNVMAPVLHISVYFLACCSLWGWIQASSVPLGLSFTILAFFHWVMKKLEI
jgi:Na+/H+ antiporter NhaA